MSVVAHDHLPPEVVDGGVAGAAEQASVVDGGGSAVGEVHDVVAVGPGRRRPALGAALVAPLDLLTAYAALRTRDRAMLPRFSGYDASVVAAPLMSSMAADMTYSLLQGVAQQGTGWRAMNILGDDYALAGKTGTAGKGRELVFVGFARDLVALLWVGVVSGTGAVSSQHASDVVVEPWARILRAYENRDSGPFTNDVAAPLIDPGQVQRWISRFVHVGERHTM